MDVADEFDQLNSLMELNKYMLFELASTNQNMRPIPKMQFLDFPSTSEILK